MDYRKRRLAVFLSMLIAFTTVFCVVPGTSVQAAENVYLRWFSTGYYGTVSDMIDYIEVEKGAKEFYIGDCVYADAPWGEPVYGYLSMNSGVKYSSSKKSVATVNAKGKITAKKKGTTTITVKFKGVTDKVELRVVDSLKDNRPAGFASMKAMAQKYIKAYGTGINSKNRYAALSAYKAYKASGIEDSGVYGYYRYNNRRIYSVYGPELVHASVQINKMTEYGDERNPIGTASAKKFQIKKLSGKEQKITATLSRKVSADDIFGLQYGTKWSTDVSDAKEATFSIYVRDTKTNHKYYAVATAKKGSKNLVIKTRSLKLKKGREYQLVTLPGYRSNWLNESVKISFTAK